MTVKSIFRQSDLNVMEKTVYCFGFVLLVLMFWVFFYLGFCRISLSVRHICLRNDILAE